MYKNIIPGLVSFETDLDEIKGFVMCQDFNFFEATAQQNPFHYKIIVSDTIEAPVDYDFRSEYFIKKDGFCYYDRKVFFWHPVFRYDFENRTFFFNRAYLRLPFKLGGIFTVGEHISNLIELDLFLHGHVILRGIAAQVKGKNIGISAPGFNGKTTLLKKLLQAGAEYIAEDYLVLHLQERVVYPTCPLVQENFWRRRKIDSELSNLLKRSTIFKNPAALDMLYLIQNSENPEYQADEKKFVDFLLLNSMYFLDNFFVRSYIYDQRLTETVFTRVQEIRDLNINYTFVGIKDFDFYFIG